MYNKNPHFLNSTKNTPQKYEAQITKQLFNYNYKWSKTTKINIYSIKYQRKNTNYIPYL